MKRADLAFRIDLIAEAAGVENFGGVTPPRLITPLLALAKACRETGYTLDEALGLRAETADAPPAAAEDQAAGPPSRSQLYFADGNDPS